MTPEQETAHWRAKGFEAEVVGGELRITLGERRRDKTEGETRKEVSKVLGLDGKPLGESTT